MFSFSYNKSLGLRLLKICEKCTYNRKCSVRLYCDKRNEKNISNKNTNAKSSLDSLNQPSLETKYTVFNEFDSPVVLDVYEEKMQLEIESKNKAALDIDEFYGLNLERGVRGVFDLEDLIDLLRRDRAEDIFVAVLPPEAQYVDHIVVVNGKSAKHMAALADIVRRAFKKKRLPTDIIPKIEGEQSADWMALDLGNIALHIFSRDARKIYDLESLWSVGPEFDPLINKPEDPVITLLKKHAISLSDVKSKGELG